MSEIDYLKKLHEAQFMVLTLRCRLAGLKGKCMGIIEYGEKESTLGLYAPEEVRLAKEIESEIEEILNQVDASILA